MQKLKIKEIKLAKKKSILIRTLLKLKLVSYCLSLRILLTLFFIISNQIRLGKQTEKK